MRSKVASYLNKLVGFDVAGFRIDAAKHMMPADLLNIVDRLNDLNTTWFPSGKRPFVYQEVMVLKYTYSYSDKDGSTDDRTFIRSEILYDFGSI